MEDTLSLDNEEDVYPNLKEVEGVYVERLEKAKSKDTTETTSRLLEFSDQYGVIGKEELKEALK